MTNTENNTEGNVTETNTENNNAAGTEENSAFFPVAPSNKGSISHLLSNGFQDTQPVTAGEFNTLFAKIQEKFNEQSQLLSEQRQLINQQSTRIESLEDSLTGIIVASLVNSLGEKYLRLDGSAYDASEYRKLLLWASRQGAYRHDNSYTSIHWHKGWFLGNNANANNATRFRVPNFAGYFLRGSSGSNILKGEQGDTIKSHNHYISLWEHKVVSKVTRSPFIGIDVLAINQSIQQTTFDRPPNNSGGVSRARNNINKYTSSNGATETRPKSMVVNFFIHV